MASRNKQTLVKQPPKMSSERDEPLTPAGRLFVQPEMNQEILCVFGTKQPLQIDAIKSVVDTSLLANHPRLSSLLVVDKHGRECWRKTEVDLDRHFIIRHDPIDGIEDDEEAVYAYMSDLAISSPLDTNKPLWEVHLLTSHKCAVLRGHHALGDGVSLLSVLMTMFRRADDPEKLPTLNTGASSSASSASFATSISSKNVKGQAQSIFLRLLKAMWFTAVFVIDFMARILWVRDERTVLTGGAGVELWPKKLVTARFLLEDMRTIKNAIPNTTINDVLFGVVSLGLSQYLDMRSPGSLSQGLRITGVAIINLRPLPGMQDFSEMMSNTSVGWGNKFGMLLLPIYYHRSSASDPLEYLRRAKAMIDRKKSSFEGFLSYKIGYIVMCILGAKYASMLNYRILCNTTFTITNMIGPKEKITFAGNPIDYYRATSTGSPHAIMMHMLSYAGWADLQIMVAKDVIPDPELIAKCMKDAMHKMKEAALPATGNHEEVEEKEINVKEKSP